MMNKDIFDGPILFPASEYSKMLSEKYHYNEWMVSRFLNYVPDPEKLLEYADSKSNLHTYIRVNTLKIRPASLKVRLLEKGFRIKDTLLDEVFEIIYHKQNMSSNTTNSKASKNDNTLYASHASFDSLGSINVDKSNSLVDKIPSLGSTFEYLKGYYYIQDLSSCVAVNEMDIYPSDDFRILDMAAAPGGKTTHIAQKMNNLGQVVACEPNPNRLPALVFNLSRLGIKNTIVLRIRAEGINKLGLKFDRVLLDAPCTCEGVILKDESRKRSRTTRDLKICSDRQKKMILAGFEALKVNGIMIYSTCSFAPEENEMVIQFLIDRFKNAHIETLNNGSSGLKAFCNFTFSDKMSNTKRFYPHYHDTNGFFIAKIRKVAETYEV